MSAPFRKGDLVVFTELPPVDAQAFGGEWEVKKIWLDGQWFVDLVRPGSDEVEGMSIWKISAEHLEFASAVDALGARAEE